MDGVPASLENVLEAKLDNARIDGRAINLPERRILPSRVGIPELGSIKGIVKLGTELESMPFAYHCVFDNRNIPVKLAGTSNNASSGIAPANAIANGWYITECAGVQVT